jgi:hypothetical protein
VSYNQTAKLQAASISLASKSLMELTKCSSSLSMAYKTLAPTSLSAVPDVILSTSNPALSLSSAFSSHYKDSGSTS